MSVRRHPLILLAGGCLGAVLALGLASTTVPLYEREAVLHVGPRNEGAVDAYHESQLAESQVNTLSAILSRRDTVTRILADAGLQELGSDARVTSSVPLGTTLIEVTVESPREEDAERVAEAIAEGFEGVIRPMGTGKGLSIVPVGEAEGPQGAVSPRLDLHAVWGLLIGLLIAAVLAFWQDWRPRKWKDRDGVRPRSAVGSGLTQRNQADAP